MAVTGVVKPFAYPDGLSSTDRWQFFHGNIVLSGTGNYAAGGIVLVWNPMTSATTGGNEFPLSLTTIPKFAYAYSGTGLPYVYTISPTTGNLLVAPGQGVTNASATASAFSITSNVVTITATNTFAAGDQVLLQGFATATYLNGSVVTVISTGLSGSAFEFNFTHANTSGSDTGTATRISIPVGTAIPAAVIADTIVFEATFAKD